MATTGHVLKLLAVLCYFCLASVHVEVTAQPNCSSYFPTGVGNAVSVSAVCYPNGSAIATWFTTATDVRRVQIEYRCYPDNDIPKVQPESTVVIEWATILDGSELVHDVWDENTTCFFSGCYETASFSTFWIQSANCTLPPPPTFVAPTITRSLQLPSITQTEGAHPTTATLPSVTPTGGPGSPPTVVTKASQLETGGVIAIAVAVAFGSMVCVIVTIIGFKVYQDRNGQYKPRRNRPYGDKVNLDFKPVDPDSRNTPTEEDDVSKYELLISTAATDHELDIVSQDDAALPIEDEQSIHMQAQAAVGDPEDTTSPEMVVQEQEELIQRGTIYSPESMNSAGYIDNDTGHDLLHR